MTLPTSLPRRAFLAAALALSCALPARAQTPLRLVIVPHVMKLSFDTLRDLAPIGQIGLTPEVVGVYPGLGITTLQQLKGGTLRPLAVTTERRDEFLPEVLTAAELGFASVNAANWIGLFVPGRTPPDLVARLHAALAKVLAMPEVAQQLRATALMPASSPSPAAFVQFMAQDHARWAQVVRTARVTNE